MKIKQDFTDLDIQYIRALYLYNMHKKYKDYFRVFIKIICFFIFQFVYFILF